MNICIGEAPRERCDEVIDLGWRSGKAYANQTYLTNKSSQLLRRSQIDNHVRIILTTRTLHGSNLACEFGFFFLEKKPVASMHSYLSGNLISHKAVRFILRGVVGYLLKQG